MARLSPGAADAAARKSVYLAGAIEYAPDGGKAWRREMADFLSGELSLGVFDPCVNELDLMNAEEKRHFRAWKQHDRARFLPVIHRIIDHDLDRLVNHTAFVVCLWDEHVSRGAGTAGELTMAYVHRVPVYLVRTIPPSDLSSWAAGCATGVFDDFGALKDFLRAERAAGRI